MIKVLTQMIGKRLRYFVWGSILFLLSGCSKLPGMPEDIQNGGVEGYETCWPCQVYQTTFEAIDKIVDTMAKNSCQYALTLLGLGLLFWLLFHIGKFLTTVKEPNVREFLFPITTLLFKAMVVSALIGLPTGSSERPYLLQIIGDDILQPLLSFFSEIAKTVLDYNDTVKSATQYTSVSNTFLENLKNSAPDGSLDNTLFGESGGPLVDVVYRIYIALGMGARLGFHIFAKPGFVSFMFGLFVICMFWMLLLTLPLMFLDALVRICAMLILLPFLLVGWIFPLESTKNLLSKAWGVMLGSGVVILFTSFYVSLVVFLIEAYAKAHETDFPVFSSAAQETDPVLAMEIKTLTSPTLAFFALMLAVNKLSAHIPDLANQFGGEAPKSSMIRVVGGVKQMSIAAGKAAIALAVASPAMAKQALDDTKEVVKDMAKGAGSSG